MFHAILIDFWQDQMAYPDMRKAAMKEYETKYGENDRAVDCVVVENKASGQSLIQDLRRTGMNVIEYNPSSREDKLQRAHLVSHLVKDGYVWLPESRQPSRRGMPCDWANTLVEQATFFPHTPNDDAVDSMVAFLSQLSKMGYMRSSGLPEKESFWKRGMKGKTVYG